MGARAWIESVSVTKRISLACAAALTTVLVLGGAVSPDSAAAVPAFEVHIEPGYDGGIDFKDWPEGGTLTITVDDPATAQNPDFAIDELVQPNEPGNDGFGTGFGYAFKGGDIVTVTDGVSTKIHTVAPIVVTSIDVEDDVIYGSANPGGISVYCDDSDVGREVTADSAGDWAADFSAPPVTSMISSPDHRAPLCRPTWTMTRRTFIGVCQPR